MACWIHCLDKMGKLGIVVVVLVVDAILVCNSRKHSRVNFYSDHFTTNGEHSPRKLPVKNMPFNLPAHSPSSTHICNVYQTVQCTYIESILLKKKNETRLSFPKITRMM
jgi:hypothetical protein